MVINLFKKKSSVPVITLIIPHFDIAFFGFIQKCNISVFSKEIYILSEHTSISGFIERKHFFLPQWHQRICKVHLIVEHFFCYILCLWIISLAVIIGEYIFLSFFFFCFLFFFCAFFGFFLGGGNEGRGSYWYYTIVFVQQKLCIYLHDIC